METLTVNRIVLKPEELKAIRATSPNCKQVGNIIKEEACIYSEGKLVAVYLKAQFDMSPILSACLNLQPNRYVRQSGLVTQTVNLNASPRNAQRDNFCRFSRLKNRNPEQHSVFDNAARNIATHYRSHFKQCYASQVKQSYVGDKKIDHKYLIHGTPFTGGVINKDSALGYHYDSANTPNGISCMLILKSGVAGGELILPELDVGFACQNGYMLLFDGQAFLHGVTPIIKPNPKAGYRYTIVYYNNKGMHLCLPPEEEYAYYRTYLEKQTENNIKESKLHGRQENN